MPPKPQDTNQTNNTDYQKLSLKEFWSVSKWTVGFIFKLSPVSTTAWALAAILNQFRHFANTYIFAKALDALIEVASKPGSNVSELYKYLGIMFGFNLTMTMISFTRNLAMSRIRTASRPLVNQFLYFKLRELGIQVLEQPELNNRLHRVENAIQDMLQFTEQAISAVGAIARMLTAAVVVLHFNPFLAVLMITINIPYVLNDKKYRGLSWKLMYETTEENRKAGSSSRVLKTIHDLAEVSISNAFGYFDRKYIAFWDWYNKKRMAISLEGLVTSYSLSLLSDIVSFFGYFQIFKNLLKGAISVGTVSFQMRMLDSFQSSFSETFSLINNLGEFSIQMKDAYVLFHSKPAFEDGTIEFPQLTSGPEIEFKNVSFKYPTNDKKVIEGLNLKININEKVAIVGHNGAGKTTLVKLICRLYQVTEGELVINGHNINNLHVDSLYKNFGVLFQEFNTYSHLSVKENIAVGDPNIPIDNQRVIQAATAADALDFIEEFPNKFDQLLGTSFKGGIKPSTGQWQKIAIARFFYRNAPLVIFDEPTASIDAVSEYNIFNKIYEFFNNKTVIIISHRFSTVRNADRILYMDHGKIIEEGSHSQLMALNGAYAKAFQLQAEGYVDTIR